MVKRMCSSVGSSAVVACGPNTAQAKVMINRHRLLGGGGHAGSSFDCLRRLHGDERIRALRSNQTSAGPRLKFARVRKLLWAAQSHN